MDLTAEWTYRIKKQWTGEWVSTNYLKWKKRQIVWGKKEI